MCDLCASSLRLLSPYRGPPGLSLRSIPRLRSNTPAARRGRETAERRGSVDAKRITAATRLTPAAEGSGSMEASKQGAPTAPITRSQPAYGEADDRLTRMHHCVAGPLLKRSEWLKQWNPRQVVVAPQLISWYSRGKQTGSCVLDRNCSVTTTADGRLVLQTSRGRELQFRCDDRADLLLWLRAVQLAARPSAPGAPPSPSLAEHLPPTVPALSARLPCAPRDGLDCDALFAPSSPPPPPQLLSKEAIASIDWGTVRACTRPLHRTWAWSCLHAGRAPHLRASPPRPVPVSRPWPVPDALLTAPGRWCTGRRP